MQKEATKETYEDMKARHNGEEMMFHQRELEEWAETLASKTEEELRQEANIHVSYAYHDMLKQCNDIEDIKSNEDYDFGEDNMYSADMILAHMGTDPGNQKEVRLLKLIILNKPHDFIKEYHE